MRRRGRPRGAQSGPRAKLYHCSWGTPNHQVQASYADEVGARHKAVAELETMRKWGERYSTEMADGCARAITEINQSSIVHERRTWTARDDLTGLTFTVTLWRTT